VLSQSSINALMFTPHFADTLVPFPASTVLSPAPPLALQYGCQSPKVDYYLAQIYLS
jgi:hypothetical protein